MASLEERWASEEGTYGPAIKVSDSPRPAGKVTAATLTLPGTKAPLGFVYTDGKLTGFYPSPRPTSEHALVTQIAGMVINKVGPAAVTANDRFDGVYDLGAAKEYPTLKAAYQALLA